MIQAGKRLMEQLEKDNPKLSVLARAHAFLVENPLFLFVGAGIFLWVHKHSCSSVVQSLCVFSTLSNRIIIEISVDLLSSAGCIDLIHNVFPGSSSTSTVRW